LTGIVLQARLDSTRLPEKALLSVGGKPLIFRVMEALNCIPADLRILACAQDSLSSFSPLAAQAGFEIFAGPKDDVLERYCQVIRRFDITRVIRATGDNPFVFTDAAAAINAEALALNADYAGYSELPYGAGVESVCAPPFFAPEAKRPCLMTANMYALIYTLILNFSAFTARSPRFAGRVQTSGLP